MYFFPQFLNNFFILLVLLIIAKGVLIVYRMVIGVWPKSIKYLVSIIEWEKEMMKIGALGIVAVLITALTFKR